MYLLVQGLLWAYREAAQYGNCDFEESPAFEEEDEDGVKQYVFNLSYVRMSPGIEDGK